MRMNYGDRLKYARETLRGMTQPRLAEMSGVGQGSISKIELGNQGPSAHDIPLCKALNINPFWLRYEEEPIELPKNRTSSSSELPTEVNSQAMDFALMHFMSVAQDPANNESLEDEEFRRHIFDKCYEAYFDEDSKKLPTKTLLRLVS